MVGASCAMSFLHVSRELDGELEGDDAAHGCAEDRGLLESEVPDDGEDVACGLGRVHGFVDLITRRRGQGCSVPAAVVGCDCVFVRVSEAGECPVEG